MIVYQITNRVNGKKYIGITTQTPVARFKAHKQKARNGSRCAVHCAMRKYGAENFSIEAVVEAQSVGDLFLLEMEYIKQNNTLVPTGYNVSSGGRGGSRYRKTPEATEKSAAWHRGKSRSTTCRERMSRGQRGKKMTISDKVRAHIQILIKIAAQTPWTKERRERARNAMLGKKLSATTRSKIAASLKGKRKARFAVEKMAATKRGKPLSQTHRDKLKRAWDVRKAAARNTLFAGAGCAHEENQHVNA